VQSSGLPYRDHRVPPEVRGVLVEQNLPADHAALVDVEGARRLDVRALERGHLVDLELTIAIGISSYFRIALLQVAKRGANAIIH